MSGEKPFDHQKKDLLTIAIVTFLIVGILAVLKLEDKQSNISAKIGQKLGTKYIK